MITVTDILQNTALLIQTLEEKTVGNPEVTIGVAKEVLTLRFEWYNERWGYEHHVELDVIRQASDERLIIQRAVNAASKAIESKIAGFSTAGNQW